MANLCIVSHIFYAEHANISALEKLNGYLRTVAQEYDKETQSPLGWMFRDKNETIDNLRINIRNEFDLADIGDIEALDESNVKFALEETSAWKPCDAAWSTILKHFPGVKHAYVGFEPLGNVFVKHDPDNLFKNRQYIVFTDMTPDASYGIDVGAEDGLLKFLKETFKVTKDYTVANLTKLKATCAEIAKQHGTYLDILHYQNV